MLLRWMTSPFRKLRRRALHRRVMRGQSVVDAVRSLGYGALSDVGYELRQTRTVETRQLVTALGDGVASVTRQVLIDLNAITNLPLAPGESPLARTELAMSRYRYWCLETARLTRDARLVRRSEVGTPLPRQAADRTDLKKDFATVATVGGVVALGMTSPGAALLGLMWFTAAVLLLAEIVLGKDSCLVALCWLACAGLVLWKQSALADWAHSARPWLLLIGLVVVGLMSLTAALRSPARPDTGHERDPRQW